MPCCERGTAAASACSSSRGRSSSVRPNPLRSASMRRLASRVRYVVAGFRRVNDLDQPGARILLQTHREAQAQVRACCCSLRVDAAPQCSRPCSRHGVVAAVGAASRTPTTPSMGRESSGRDAAPAEAAGLRNTRSASRPARAASTPRNASSFARCSKRREYAAGEILSARRRWRRALRHRERQRVAKPRSRGALRKAIARAAPELLRLHALRRDRAARSRGGSATVHADSACVCLCLLDRRPA